ncbi:MULTISPECIES: hypothetical protein [unclassified Rhizobium]|uniref:hypothetical protein n=1 Tax=unclassified Rhizobium TaxID=2613769 RepID=UPI001ADA4D49|nr:MULTISPECIES: hypothetical protein [unclassified Rhizobium]MBO9102304.1 hypothetical protein [Rhizobium sp. L58/93]QXZ87299.1 hypothetical protein J5287_22385 [Rhizobium sp. K1/93]QXZ92668.1 hypothetical protein J5280_26800 [Rhizobium sp. K15/93]
MRVTHLLAIGFVALTGCAGKYEQMAKCSADENPVPAPGYGTELKPTAAEVAVEAATKNDCGPMRPVNQFQDETWIPSVTR